MKGRLELVVSVFPLEDSDVGSTFLRLDEGAPEPSTTTAYKPLRWLTLLVGASLGANVLCTFVTQASLVWLRRYDPGVFLGNEARDAASAIGAILLFLGSVGQFLAFVPSVIFFLCWLARANRNARALGAEGMEFTPAMTAVWFFVPILNLFKPYEAVEEIYLASDPESEPYDWGAAKSSRLILAWWLCWIGMGVWGSLLGAWDQALSRAALLTPLWSAAAAGLALMVLLQIERRQGRKKARIDALAASNAPRVLAVS